MILAAPLAAFAVVVLVVQRGRRERLREQRLQDADIDEARAILGVGGRAGRDEIVAAHRSLIARVHPDRGGDELQARRANAARDLLLRGH